VSRYLLDTNIISNVTKPSPSAVLTAWMADQADEDLFISALTVAEIRRGLLDKPTGKKRQELERWFLGPDGPGIFSRDEFCRSMRKPGWCGQGSWPTGNELVGQEILST
jgi:hypothetical protein